MNKSIEKLKIQRVVFLVVGILLAAGGTYLIIEAAGIMNDPLFDLAKLFDNEDTRLVELELIAGIIAAVAGVALIILGVIAAANVSKLSGTVPMSGAPMPPMGQPGMMPPMGQPGMMPSPAPSGMAPVQRSAAVDPVGKTDRYGGNNFAPGKILCISGAFEGASFPIQNHEIIRIGTNPTSSNIIITNKYVSAFHCSVEYDAAAGAYIVTDHSTNGTFFQDGTRLPKGKPAKCPVGTVINIYNDENSYRLN